MAYQTTSHGALRRAFLVLDRVAGWIDNVARVVIGAALLMAFCLLLFQVLVRYVLPFPVPWLEEAATYLSGYMAMIGASVCLRVGYHLQVDLLRDALPVSGQHILMIIQNLLVFGFGLFLLRYGIAFVQLGQGQTSPSTFFLVSHARMAMPIGGALLMLQAFILMGRSTIALIDHRQDSVGPPAGGQISDG